MNQIVPAEYGQEKGPGSLYPAYSYKMMKLHSLSFPLFHTPPSKVGDGSPWSGVVHREGGSCIGPLYGAVVGTRGVREALGGMEWVWTLCNRPSVRNNRHQWSIAILSVI
jgi:hypothetical protein